MCQIKFNVKLKLTSMLSSSLCDYSETYIIVGRTITVPNTRTVANPNNRKNIIIKNCATFTDCISEKNNMQIDNTKETDIVIPMCILIKYNDSYFQTFGSLWQYYRDEPLLNNNGAIADVPLKHLSNFWKTLEMSLINCEINFILTWSTRCFIIDTPIFGQEPTFTTTDTKLYVPVVTLSAQANEKLLAQLILGFKRAINCNKYHQNVTVQQRNQYLDFLTNPNFQGANRLFVSSFENNGGRTSYTTFYLPLVEIKDYNVMIDGRKCF